MYLSTSPIYLSICLYTIYTYNRDNLYLCRAGARGCIRQQTDRPIKYLEREGKN